MKQLSFIEPAADEHPADPEDSEHLPVSTAELLEKYRMKRLRDGANARSVDREVSQLRSIVRESGAVEGPTAIGDLFRDLQIVANVLCEPVVAISRATSRTRLIAAQRFITYLSEVRGLSANEVLARLDALLPARRTTNWQSAGTLVAGTTSRRRRLSATLDVQDLHRILHAAGHQGPRTDRDSALVAMHCFSGLRPE